MTGNDVTARVTQVVSALTPAPPNNPHPPGGRCRQADGLRDRPALAAPAVTHRYTTVNAAPGWWLHIDLDVLDRHEFSACGAASDDAMPGGLSWSELAAIASSALQAGGARGWSLASTTPTLTRSGTPQDGS
jgi:hypothetical protein